MNHKVILEFDLSNPKEKQEYAAYLNSPFYTHALAEVSRLLTSGKEGLTVKEVAEFLREKLKRNPNG